MKTLLVAGTGTDQTEGILEAKNMGLYTVGIDGNEKSEGKNLVDEFYKVNIKDINAVTRFISQYQGKLDGIIAFGVDIPEILAKVAEIKNLYYQLDYQEALISKNKFLAKQILKEAGVNVPPYLGVKSINDLKRFVSEFGLPVILKPVDNSASRGVLYLTNEKQLKWALNESIKYVRNHTFSPPLIVEKFIEGQQLSTESIILDGKIFTIGLSERNYELLKVYAPLIIENGGDLPPKLNHFKDYKDMITKIDEQIEKAVKAFNSRNGTVKGDIVIDSKGKVWIIEVAFRLSGGLFSTIEIPLNTNINFLKKAIEIQLYGRCNPEGIEYKVKNTVRLRYMFTEKKSGIIKDIILPKTPNTIFKIYSKPGINIKVLHSIYRLPLIKLTGYVIWGKSRKEIAEIDGKIKENTKIIFNGEEKGNE